MNVSRVVALALLNVAALVFAACSAETAEVQAEAGATAFTYQDLTISGTSVKGYVATTSIQRTRAEQVIRFGDNDGKTAAILVYGGEEKPLVVSPRFNSSADMAFLNRAGEVVKIYADEERYTPVGVQYQLTGNQNAPHLYRSDEPASVVLLASPGLFSKIGISTGVSLKGKISPSDPFKAATESNEGDITLYFRKRSTRDSEREELPVPTEVSVRLATTGEERARPLKDSEDGVLLLYPSNDNSWQEGGFWLKGTKGNVSFAFMRLTAGRGGSNSRTALQGSIATIVEGVQDTESNDIERPIWWPSEVETSDGVVNAIVVLRGADAFSSKEIEENFIVLTTSVYLRHPGQYRDSAIIADDPEAETIYSGGSKYDYELFSGKEKASNLASALAKLRDDELGLLVWDSVDSVSLQNDLTRDVSVALLSTEGGKNFSIARSVTIGASSTQNVADAPSRYALILNGKSLNGTLQLPWQIVALKPVDYLRGAFYSGATKFDDHPTTWPSKAKGFTKVNLEVADTVAARTRGLMFRESLPTDTGMIFIYEEEGFHEYWMKNCKMNLSIAFLDDKLKIITIHNRMTAPEPGTPDSELELWSSRGDAKYAVEMRENWFEDKGFAPGDYLWVPAIMKEPSGNR